MDTHVNDPGSGQVYLPHTAAAPPIDLGLRNFMLRVFNTMAGGLVQASRQIRPVECDG
jgi:hypothetical protein